MGGRRATPFSSSWEWAKGAVPIDAIDWDRGEPDDELGQDVLCVNTDTVRLHDCLVTSLLPSLCQLL